MPKHPKIFAHRGARAVTPENTLFAFQKALDMGVDGIELDVQASSDGVLFVMHDFGLERTSTGTGLLTAHTAAELDTYDAGSYFGAAFTGAHIPTLEQVLDLVGDRCLVNVEIKNLDWDGGREVEPLVTTIQRRRLHDQVIVSSFNPIALIKMRWLDPSIPLGLLYKLDLPIYLRRAWFGPLIAPEAMHPHHSLVDEAFMARARSQGQFVNTWTVNDPEEARRLARLGVDVIISDVPDQIMAALATSEHDTPIP